jgi:hypothetical protein
MHSETTRTQPITTRLIGNGSVHAFCPGCQTTFELIQSARMPGSIVLVGTCACNGDSQSHQLELHDSLKYVWLS